MQAAEYREIADKYTVTIEENRRLYNEVQDLKGNIRVFCRVRPQGATGDFSEGNRSLKANTPKCKSLESVCRLSTCVMR